MTLKERRTHMGIVGTELAYCEAIDRETAKTFVPNYWSASANCAGSFCPNTKYNRLSKHLSRYRFVTKGVKCPQL